MFDLWGLAYSARRHVLRAQSRRGGRQNVLAFENKQAGCAWTPFCVSITCGRTLGFCRPLVDVDSAAMDGVGRQVFETHPQSSGRAPKRNCWIGCSFYCKLFEKLPKFFFANAPFYISTGTQCIGFQFFHKLINTCYYHFFKLKPS